MTALLPSPSRLNPYVGPRPFEPGERLYGRDREVARLRDLLIAERIVLLYSPSGAGKTSLIRAGLVPELEREGFRVLPEIRVATALAPVDDLGRRNRYRLNTLLCLEQDRPAERQHDLDELADMGLADYLDQRDGEHDGEVLIFDQFEELLTADVTDQDAKSAFLTELGAVLRDRRRWALFAMREDCVAGLDPYLRLLPTRLRATFRLDLLGEAAARMAIQSPAREAGVDFSDAAARKLADSLRRVHVRRSGRLVEALGPHIEPVQLQVVCERLWERPRIDALCITESDVQEVGDIESALASYYNDKVRAIATETGADERAIRTWFHRALITDQDLRSQVLAGPLDGASEDERVLRLLEDAHLVRAETRGGVRWFELAHDRLIEPVRTSNTAWFDANLQPFQRQAPLWQGEYQPDRLLLTGDALAEADRWVEEHSGQVTPVERKFLTASHRAHDELQRKQRSAQRIRRLAVATSILTVVSLLALVLAGYQNFAIRSQGFASEAMGLLDTDPAEALDRAVKALRWRWVSPPQAQRALISALAQSHARAILKGHAGSVTSANFSPDGRLVVTVGADSTARLWSPTTGNELAKLGSDVFSARFSPDGSQVVVTANRDNTARVWDAKTGREQTVLRGHEGPVVSAQWSPDGARVVTASSDKTARVWDAKTGREQTVLRGHEGPVVSAEWSPDGARVVTTSSDNTARVWDAQTGGGLAKLAVPNSAGSVDAVFLDATHVIAAGTDAAYLWEWGADQTPVKLFGGKPEFSPDKRYVLTVDGQKVRVWDARSGMSVVELKGHEDPVSVARFSLDSAHIVSGSEDGIVRIWDVATAAMLVELRGHEDKVNDVAFSSQQPDPTRPVVVTASADGTARVWNPSIGRVLHGSTAGLNRASLSADGTLVVGAGADGVARVWRAGTGEQLAELRADPQQPLGSAAFSPDGRYIATGGRDGIVRMWKWRTKVPVAAVHVGGNIRAVVFDPLGRFVAIAEDASKENASIWEWATGKSLSLDGHRQAVTDAAFSPDGSRLVTVSLDRTARVWDAATGKELRQLGSYRNQIYSADFSPDGRFIVTASAGKAARVWDAATGKEFDKLKLKGHKRGLKDVAFSPDGNYIVTGADDGTVGVWKASTGNRLALLPLHSSSVTSVQFSPNSRVILTASQDGTARIYDCEICVPLGDLRKLAEDRHVRGRIDARQR